MPSEAFRGHGQLQPQAAIVAIRNYVAFHRFERLSNLSVPLAGILSVRMSISEKQKHTDVGFVYFEKTSPVGFPA
jgi:hypothetical protein